ncbi:MAG TPA: CoA transferase [Burkholderiaceae bacterium]|nr:CoA transferase [Burkholderiaceae bacterium]
MSLSPLETLWHDAALAPQALARLTLRGGDPVLPSSFAVGLAAQTSIALAALAAAEIGLQRSGAARRVEVAMRDAAIECTARYTLDGVAPDPWDKLAGLYRGRSGWVRVHTNFAHHRDALLRVLGLPEGASTERAAVAQALARHDAVEFEDSANAAGCVVAALRSFDEWDAHPQAACIAAQPLVAIERIGDAPPLAWPACTRGDAPLAGLRVLDMTRILAGPFGTRLLAAHGADVLLVNAPHLPNIDAIADLSRGKRSAFADLRAPADRDALRAVLRQAHAFVQGYRPGAIAALGLDAGAVAGLRPGIVVASLSAYGETGPWGSRRGFDSLVQTATGFNHAEALAAESDAPRALPLQILDMASGALLTFGVEAALLRQRTQGGSWRVGVSLARTGLWLRGLGRIGDGFRVAPDDGADLLETAASGFGTLGSVRHAARFVPALAHALLPSMPPGTHPLAWPISG